MHARAEALATLSEKRWWQQGLSLGDLALQPGMRMVQQLWNHCQNILEQQAEPASDAEDDQEGTPAEQQMMAEKTRILAAAGRLVAFQVQLRLAPCLSMGADTYLSSTSTASDLSLGHEFELVRCQ